MKLPNEDLICDNLDILDNREYSNDILDESGKYKDL
jgi:hypothetical protein